MRLTILACAALLALAGCADPMRDVPRLSGADLPDGVGGAGLARAPEGDLPDSGAGDDAPRGGLLGFLRGRADAAQEASDPTLDGSGGAGGTPQPDTVQTAALDMPADAGGGRGLFGGLFGGGTGGSDSGDRGRGADRIDPDAPDARQVGPGVTLPYGEVARLCGVPVQRMGREIATWPETRPVYRLIDTDPGNTAPHTFFLTGFDDGCARQFTAALAMFGDPEMHERIRYGAPSGTLPASQTDSVYEKVKSRICRVAPGNPCGARIDRLSRDTVFVSIYESFGGVARWKNLLLHDGQVAALDIKSR